MAACSLLRVGSDVLEKHVREHSRIRSYRH
jgi:hypothetical protein